MKKKKFINKENKEKRKEGGGEMKKRKGSMSLGVNSIIILIIAVIVLGLIIGFINQMFGKISKQVQLPECTPEMPSGSNPLTLCPETVVASPGEQLGLNVMLFNNQQNDITINNVNIECTEPGLVENIKMLPVTISAGQSKKFGVTFNVKSGVGKGMYICRLSVYGYNYLEKELKVRVE